MDESRILELDRLATDMVGNVARRRFEWAALGQTEGRPFVALLGPRGSGKTVLLRQLRREHEGALYVSADTLDPQTDLFGLVRAFHENLRIDRFYLDEIHFIADYSQHLKQIFDFLPVRVWFTSSVALSLTAAGWDLSRRVVRHTLLPFSYREFLWFKGDPLLGPLPLGTALTEPIPKEYLRQRGRFDAYLRGGLHPFMLEPGATTNAFPAMLEKVITQDIPRFDRQLSTEDIDRLRKTVEYIGRCPVEGVNYSSTAANVGITKYKAEKYLGYLERSFILTRILPSGTNVLREPKVLMQLPYRLIHQSYEQAIDALREEFFVLAAMQHGCSPSYAKSTRGAKTPDYVMDIDGVRTVVEIGGRRKGRTQFKGLDYERKIVLADGDLGDAGAPRPGERVPLFCVGFA